MRSVNDMYYEQTNTINNLLCVPFSQLPEKDYQSIIQTLQKLLPTTMKCPRSIAKHCSTYVVKSKSDGAILELSSGFPDTS